MKLEERISQTLRLFALQQTALTLLELYRFLLSSRACLSSDLATGENGEDGPGVTLAAVEAALAAMVSAGYAAELYGYYAPSGRADLPGQRWLGYQYGLARERRIHRFTKGLAYIPFIRGVALAGSQALGLQRPGSDIDLLIITAPGWLWLPRTLVTAYFQFLGMRRHGAAVAGRVCLNHYISGFKTMTQGQNLYTAIEYAKLRSLYGTEAVAKFQDANWGWIRNFFPHAQVAEVEHSKPGMICSTLERILSTWLGRKLEGWLAAWQSKRIRKNEPHIIVASDELSFHPESKQDPLLRAFYGAAELHRGNL